MRSLEAVAGQKPAVTLLTRALQRGKVAHAYLFEGPDGTGKRTTALALAATILCAGGDGCGECPSCRKVAGLGHPDLHLLAPDGAFIKIDQVRELQRALSYRPHEGVRKVAVLEQVEKMNPAAANSLLKTLEEPPGAAVLILLTENAAGVPETILSRCQRIRFTQLAEEVIADLLVQRGFPAEAAAVAAADADGSMTRALAVAESGADGDRREILEKILALSTADTVALLERAEELGKEKESAAHVLDILQGYLRELLLHAGGAADAPQLLPREPWSTARLLELLDRVAAARRGLLRNVNPRLTLEELFLSIAGW